MFQKYIFYYKFLLSFFMRKILILATVLTLFLVNSEIFTFDPTQNLLNIDQTLAVQALNLRLPTTLNDGNPCGLKSFCGQAVPFKSEEELKSFTDKNCHPLYRFLPLELKTTAQASPSFSGTNNQEGNVDEADVLKTDGQYIYSVSGTVLSIIRAHPYPQARIASTISFTSTPSSLFIDGDYLTVFGTGYDSDQPYYYGGATGGVSSKIAYFYFRPPHTWVKVYNICDKSNPKLIKTYKFEGYYFDGRKTENGFVYLLSSLNCNGRQTAAPWYDFGAGKKNLLPPQIFYYPGNDYQGANFINIFAFNLRNPLFCEQNIVSVLSVNTYVLYMSEQYIYLTSTKYIADAQITSIHKIFVSKSKIIPMADGQVNGYVNNQFSLDEYNGTLRIATTETGITGVPTNNVFCLDKYLNVIGSLGNIALNETIFSARYVDKRLYLVTFRRIDPFFVIDLSDHTHPSILGQLKITGFSTYLHPYDANTIIGFGRQTNAQGQQQGLKLSLFDVSDVNNPQELAQFVLSDKYAYSTAEWEHKAFLFSKEKNLLVVPASYYDWEHPDNQDSYNGALVFYVKRDDFGGRIELRGIINHVLSETDDFWSRAVERSLYIDNLLYTKSSCLLRINTLAQLNPVLNLDLNCAYEQPILFSSAPAVDIPISLAPPSVPTI